MARSFLKSRFAYDFFHDPSALLGSLILVFFILAALVSPLIAVQDPYDLEQVKLTDALKPPIWKEGGQTPFLLGTDDQGRDILSTIIYGCRTSLYVGFSVILIAGSFGIIMGLLTGYYGGAVDAAVMRLADTLFSFSTTLMAFLMLGLFRGQGRWVVILAICIPDWVRYARTMRGSVLEVRNQGYIIAAKATGAGNFRIIMRHLLPNSIAPIFVLVAVDLAVVIMLEATLSFLGVGVPVTQPSLGMMISIGKNYIYAGMWWLVVFPGGVLILLVVGINLFADWLREELNPKMR